MASPLAAACWLALLACVSEGAAPGGGRRGGWRAVPTDAAAPPLLQPIDARPDPDIGTVSPNTVPGGGAWAAERPLAAAPASACGDASISALPADGDAGTLPLMAVGSLSALARCERWVNRGRMGAARGRRRAPRPPTLSQRPAAARPNDRRPVRGVPIVDLARQPRRFRGPCRRPPLPHDAAARRCWHNRRRRVRRPWRRSRHSGHVRGGQRGRRRGRGARAGAARDAAPPAGAAWRPARRRRRVVARRHLSSPMPGRSWERAWPGALRNGRSPLARSASVAA